MKKLLVLGSSFGCEQIVQAAKSYGAYTIVTDYLSPESSVAKQLADEYWMISTGDLGLLERKCRQSGITAIIAGISEFNLEQGLILAERLHLPWYCSADTWHYERHKADFKKLCRKVGVRVAEDYTLSSPPTPEELDSILFPIVIKPVDNAGNIGMSYCYTREQVIDACKLARAHSQYTEIVAERMLRGTEYIAHYALANGTAVFLGMYTMLFEPGYPANCYSYTTGCVDVLPQYMHDVHPFFLEFLKNANCRDGVCWIEMIRDDDEKFYVLEMAQRPSGDLIALPFKQINGFDTFQWLTELSIGISHKSEDLPQPCITAPEHFANSYIVWSDREAKVSRIEGVETLAKESDIYFKQLIHEGDEIQAYRYMFVIAFASNDYTSMCDTIKRINHSLRIYDNNGNNIAIYYNDFDRLSMLDQKRQLSKEEKELHLHENCSPDIHSFRSS